MCLITRWLSSLKARVSCCGITMHLYPPSEGRSGYILQDMYASLNVAHWLILPVQFSDCVFSCRELGYNDLLELPENIFGDLVSLQYL